MILRVFGSGSTGNSLALINENEILLLDLGLRYKEILKGIDYRISDVVGAVCSHVHLDHSKAIKDFEEMCVDVFKPYENYKKHIKMGGFDIFTIELKHDVPCYGFYIQHKDFGNLIYATDTCYIADNFAKLKPRLLLIECNYDKRLVDKSAHKYQHELQDHFEREDFLEFVRANYTDSLETLLICHTSKDSLNSEEILAECKNEFKCKVIEVAKKGVEIEI